MTTKTTQQKTTAQILRAAADLLEKPEAWTQGSYARDADGVPKVGVYRDCVTCWCSIGAIARAAGVDATAVHGTAFPPIEAVEEHIGITSLSLWNDNPRRTQAEVVAALRGADDAQEV